MERSGVFDNEAFFAALDAQRQALKYTWKKVAAEAGVSASTLTRMAQGKRPDVDSLAALAAWAKLEVDAFIRGSRKRDDESAEPLAMISTYLRSDRHLSPEGARALDEMIKAAYGRLRED
jgi:transcriptional regulator with XRE-family HTH domain